MIMENKNGAYVAVTNQYVKKEAQKVTQKWGSYGIWIQTMEEVSGGIRSSKAGGKLP